MAQHEPSLGEKLRRRRKQMGKTLQEVACEASLSVSFISQLERDLSSASLSSLINIARALDIGVETLVRSPVTPGPISRHGQRATYTTGAAAPTYERLSDEFPGSMLHSVVMTLPPGYRSENIAHEGEELMFVVSGRIFASVDGDARLLEAGDSVHFPSERPHHTENPDDTPAQVLWVGTLRLFDGGRLRLPRGEDMAPALETQHETAPGKARNPAVVTAEP